MQDGDTPLNCASFNGHVTVVRLLLERKAGVNICNKVSCCGEVAKYYCVRTEHFISKMLHCVISTVATFSVQVCCVLSLLL